MSGHKFISCRSAKDFLPDHVLKCIGVCRFESSGVQGCDEEGLSSTNAHSEKGTAAGVLG